VLEAGAVLGDESGEGAAEALEGHVMMVANRAVHNQ
jgi:hypothetical protein